jgi:2-phosphosulfolactate phosphatase
MVDVLRASTTIAIALARGAREVVPVETPEEARETGERVDDAVLVGERSRGKLDGFVDNSPASVAQLELSGRPVVLTTTNGTRALLASQGAGRVLVGCMANAAALREAVAGEDVALVAAGWRGEPAEDDDACCAFLAELLQGRRPDPQATVAELERSTSARKLREAGKGDDVDLCLSANAFPVVPELDGRALVASGG